MVPCKPTEPVEPAGKFGCRRGPDDVEEEGRTYDPPLIYPGPGQIRGPGTSTLQILHRSPCRLPSCLNLIATDSVSPRDFLDFRRG
jgi:hypothetical protein